MKLTYSKSGDVETLIVEHKPSWFRSLFRLPLWEQFKSPYPGVFWYKIHEDGVARPLGTFFGRNADVRALARIAKDRGEIGYNKQ